MIFTTNQCLIFYFYISTYFNIKFGISTSPFNTQQFDFSTLTLSLKHQLQHCHFNFTLFMFNTKLQFNLLHRPSTCMWPSTCREAIIIGCSSWSKQERAAWLSAKFCRIRTTPRIRVEMIRCREESHDTSGEKKWSRTIYRECWKHKCKLIAAVWSTYWMCTIYKECWKHKCKSIAAVWST